MQVTISPSDFARIMALPNGLRRDLLEFLGSTPVAAGEIDRMVHALSARVAQNPPHANGKAA